MTVLKVCIVGTTPTRGLAPFADPSWQVWTIGPGGRDVPGHRWDRLWEIHGADRWHTWPAEFGKYLDDLSKVELPKEVVTLRPIREMVVDWAYQHGKSPEEMTKEVTGPWKANVVIDREKIIGKYGRMWMSSSFSWALAQALEEKAKRIGIYGVDLECGEEYISQFAGARHFIDLAKALNVTIEMPRWCGLLRDPNPYPDRWETHEALWMINRIAMLKGMIAGKTGELDNRKAEIHRREGAIRTLDDISKNFNGKVREEATTCMTKLDAERTELLSHLGRESAELSHLNGQLASWNLYMEQFVYTGTSGKL